MILGVGVDIVHLPRIASLIARRGKEGLAKRILSPMELKEFKTLANTEEDTLRYLGSRWCVKEAAYKALFPCHKLEWKQVTVIKKEGKPYLDITHSQVYGIQRTHVSLSHDGEYAIAQVILEGSTQ